MKYFSVQAESPGWVETTRAVMAGWRARVWLNTITVTVQYGHTSLHRTAGQIDKLGF